MVISFDPRSHQAQHCVPAGQAGVPGVRASLRPHRPPIRLAGSAEAELIRQLFKICFDIGAPLATARLAVGRTYCNILVDTADARYVVRTVPTWNSARLHREAGLLQALAGTRIARRIPQLVLPIRGDAPWASFAQQDWLISQFSHGFNAKPPRGSSPDRAIVCEIGAFVGDLGRSMACIAGDIDPPFDHKGHLKKVLEHFEFMCSGADSAPPAEDAADWRAKLGSRIAPLNRVLAETPFDAGIHGDIRYANLIFDTLGAVRTMLDFDRAGVAPALLEHALAIRNLLVCESADPRQAGSISYDDVAAYMRGCRSSTGVSAFGPHSPIFLSFMELVALDELHYALTEGDPLASARRAELATTAWGLFCRAGSITPWSP